MRMAKPSDSPGFKALQAEWDKRLSESGFQDIEKTVGRQRVLKYTGTQVRYDRMDEVQRESRFEFYRQVGIRLAETRFESDFDRQVLTLFSYGYTQKEIQAELDIRGHRCKIYKPIYRWLKAWGLK